MSDQKKWDFAQIYSSREMIKIGAIYTVSSILGVFIPSGEAIGSMVSIGVLVILIVALIYRTEHAMIKKFED